MAEKNLVTVFFGLAKPEDLIGRTLKVSFRSEGDETSYVLYFKIDSFTVNNMELSFPPILYDQGISTVQVSIFRRKEFHIASYKNNWKATSEKRNTFRQSESSGYYYSNPKRFKSTDFSKGKIELV